jgi:hypothetical protein
MPLIDKHGGSRERIEITAEIDPNSAGDWYEIRTQLGYYHRLEASEIAGGSIRVPARRVTEGSDLLPDEMVSLTLDNMAQAANKKLLIWLTDWSHTEDNGRPTDITPANVRRIPESHFRAIMARIKAHEDNQWGPAKDSPLDRS